MTEVVVVTPDVVGSSMAGPGIRAWHLAKEISETFPTTLVATLQGEPREAPGLELLRAGSRDARRAIERASVVVGQPTRDLLSLSTGARRIFDLFDPTVLELQQLYGPTPSLREKVHMSREWRRMRLAMAQGDRLIAATRQQRLFYAGIHVTEGGSLDGWWERWIEVPFGVPAEPPPDDEPAIESEVPLLIWSGGLWEWLDPESALEAVRIANRRGVRCRLLLLGVRRPNPAARRATRPRRLEALLAGAGDELMWNEEWIPYDERHRWLRSARAAIMLHRRSMEAELSIRTRVFDSLWCGLPVIASRGGWAADLIEREGLGIVTPPESVEEVAAAIESIVTDDALHARSVHNLENVRPTFTWKEVARPLVDAIAGSR